MYVFHLFFQGCIDLHTPCTAKLGKTLRSVQADSRMYLAHHELESDVIDFFFAKQTASNDQQNDAVLHV